MEKSKAKSIIEAVLFAMGDPVEAKQLSQALDISEKEVKKIINEMMEDCEKEARGVRILEIDGGYQMSTKSECYEYLIKIVSTPKDHKLTDVQLETLAIIAYKQPVTKAEIENIRGVSSDHAVNRLLEAGLIEECGRLDSPGRAILFSTTKEFLRRFGLKNTEDLPEINTEKLESFKLEAEEEVGYREGEGQNGEGQGKAENDGEKKDNGARPDENEIIDVEI